MDELKLENLRLRQQLAQERIRLLQTQIMMQTNELQIVTKEIEQHGQDNRKWDDIYKEKLKEVDQDTKR